MSIPDPRLSISKFPNTYIPYWALDRQTHTLLSIFTNPRLSASLLLTRDIMMILFSSPKIVRLVNYVYSSSDTKYNKMKLTVPKMAI